MHDLLGLGMIYLHLYLPWKHGYIPRRSRDELTGVGGVKRKEQDCLVAKGVYTPISCLGFGFVLWVCALGLRFEFG